MLGGELLQGAAAPGGCEHDLAGVGQARRGGPPDARGGAGDQDPSSDR
jgi:hypothetical protein